MTEILEHRMPFIKLDSLTVLRKQRAKVFKPVEPISLLDWVARCLLDSDKSRGSNSLSGITQMQC